MYCFLSLKDDGVHLFGGFSGYFETRANANLSRRCRTLKKEYIPLRTQVLTLIFWFFVIPIGLSIHPSVII